MAAGAALGAAVIGGVSQARAGKREDAAAKENARMMELETAENARRLEAQQEENLGRARAMQHASGTTGEGSQQMVISGMQKEFGQELAWLKKSGASQAALERRRGASAKKSGRGNRRL